MQYSRDWLCRLFPTSDFFTETQTHASSIYSLTHYANTMADIYFINIKFWFSKLFSGFKFFSHFLKAFFGNKGAPYLLLIWFKVLKFVVRFCKKQCIAHKNEKHARVFDYFFQFIRELITWRLVFWQYVALDTFYSAKNLLSLFPTISANSYQNFRKIWEKRPPPKMFL